MPTLQLMSTVPEFRSKYVSKADDIFRTSPSDPTLDLGSQLSKVGLPFGAHLLN